MTEDLVVAELTQSNLDPIAVSSKILEGMETLAKKPVCFPKRGSFSTPRFTSFLDTVAKRTANESGGGIPTTVFGGHVVLGEKDQFLFCHKRAPYRPSYPFGGLSPVRVGRQEGGAVRDVRDD